MENDIAAEIARLYVTFFNRAPDPEGFEYWMDRYQTEVANGRDPAYFLEQIADSFAQSPEAKAIYENEGTTSRADIEAFITQAYANLFDRAPDPEGLSYWAGRWEFEMANGRPGVRVLFEIENAARGSTNLNDIAALDNKATVAAKFTNDFLASGRTWTAADIAFAQQIDDDVDHTDASVQAANDEIFDYFNPNEGNNPGGGNPPAPTFTIVEGEDGIVFGGTASGAVTLSNVEGVLAGSRAGVNATFPNGEIDLAKDVDLSTLNADIVLDGGLTVTIDADEIGGNSISGNGSVNVIGSADDQVIDITATGFNRIAGGQGADQISLGGGLDTIVVNGVSSDLIDAVAQAEAALEGKASADELAADLELASDALADALAEASDEELATALATAQEELAQAGDLATLQQADAVADDLVLDRDALEEAAAGTQTVLDAAQAVLDSKQSASNAASEVADDAEEALAVAQSGKSAADAAVASAITSVDAAQQEVEDAQDALGAAQQASTSAAADQDAAEVTFNQKSQAQAAAQADLNVKVTAQANAQSNLNAATNTYNVAVSQTNRTDAQDIENAAWQRFWDWYSSGTNRQGVTQAINSLTLPAALKTALINSLPNGSGTFDDNHEFNAWANTIPSTVNSFLNGLNAARTTAQNTFNAATSARQTADTVLATATAEKTAAQNALQLATAAEQAAIAGVGTAQGDLASAQAGLTDAAQDLAAKQLAADAAAQQAVTAQAEATAANEAEAAAKAELADAQEAFDLAKAANDAADAALQAHIEAHGSTDQLVMAATEAQAALDAYDAAAGAVADAQADLELRAELVADVEEANALVNARAELDAALNAAQEALDAVSADSVVGAEDTVTGFTIGEDQLYLPSRDVVGDTEGTYLVAGTDYSYSVTNGILSITSGGETVAIDTEEEFNNLLTILSNDAVIADGQTIAFEYDLDGTEGVDGLYVFQGHAGAADIGVKLAGLSADDLSTVSQLFALPA